MFVGFAALAASAILFRFALSNAQRLERFSGAAFVALLSAHFYFGK